MLDKSEQKEKDTAALKELLSKAQRAGVPERCRCDFARCASVGRTQGDAMTKFLLCVRCGEIVPSGWPCGCGKVATLGKKKAKKKGKTR